MELITHGLMGAVVGKAFFTESLGEKAIWIGVIASLVPDLDIFIYSFSKPLYELIYHRHFSHALFFAPIGSVILTFVFYCYSPEYRTNVEVIYLEILLLFLAHGLIDACTIYGTQLWWPFKNTRVAWDLIHLFNPVIGIISFIGLALSYWQHNNLYAQLSVFLFFPFLGLLFIQHRRALKFQHELSQSRHHKMHKARVFPINALFFRYRSIYVYQGKFHLDELRLPLFRKPSVNEGATLLHFTEDQLPDYVRQSPQLLHSYQVFDWFTHGYMTSVSEHPLILTDVRYIKHIKPLKVLWSMEFPPDKHVIKWHADYRNM